MRKLTIAEMLELQDDLNCYVDPMWKDSRTLDQLDMAILDECSELLGSGRKWKWWKSAGIVNDWNEKIEIIDIVHFYLSKILLHPSLSRMKTDFYAGYQEHPDTKPSFIDDRGEFEPTAFMRIVRLLIDGYGGTAMTLDRLLRVANMTTEEASALYLAKNLLNRIRQDVGYLEGTYQKHKNGKEDNERLLPIIDAFMLDTGMTLDDVKKSVEEEFLRV